MKPNFLPVAFSNSGVRLEEILGVLDREPPQEQVYGFICVLYRRLAAGALLMDGHPARFFEYLAKGAHAYAHFLDVAPAMEQRTSNALAFFDAVACHDEETARRLTRAAPAIFAADREYEEDFFAVRLLMDRFFGGAEPGQLGPALAQWSKLAAESADTRLPVCQALLDADQDAFDDAIEAAIAARRKRIAQLRESEQLDPDEASTSAHVSTEVLAWIDLAQRAGLRVKRDYPLAPASARAFAVLRLPPPDAWRVPEPFGAFDEG